MSKKNLNFDLYNVKYLKYKNKYLTLKKSMIGGTGETITITLPEKTPTSIKLSDIKDSEPLIQQIKDKLRLQKNIKVLLDDCPIEPYHTAADCMLTSEDVLKIEYIDEPKVV